jgi:hypothetical protein
MREGDCTDGWIVQAGANILRLRRTACVRDGIVGTGGDWEEVKEE